MLGRSQAILALALVPVALGQVTHFITVGVEGSFFDPPTTSAELNDIVTFIFGGDVHTVTQTTFDTPCIPLAGGFSSGFLGRGPDFSAPTPVWSLRITNASEPIWIFCEASLPTSHCESGMVGAINPPSIDSYNQFVSAAKAVTSTPKPNPSYFSSGQGAFATNSPMLSSVPLSSLLSSLSLSIPPSTSTTPLATTSPTAPVVASRAGISHGLIAGVAAAGGIVVLLVIGLAYYCGRQRMRSRAYTQATPMDSDIYHHTDKAPGARAGTGRGMRTYSPSATMTGVTVSPPTPSTTTGLLYDEREGKRSPGMGAGSPASPGIRPLPTTPSHGQLRQSGNDNAQQPPVDINALAMEVASVLLQTPPRTVARDKNTHARADTQTRSQDNSSDNTSQWYEPGEESDEGGGRKSAAPPYYRDHVTRESRV